MVIECPSCNTKFAVDAQQLADVENPRFHCSRCDHFFELEGAQKTPGTQTELFPEPGDEDETLETVLSTPTPSSLSHPASLSFPDDSDSELTTDEVLEDEEFAAAAYDEPEEVFEEAAEAKGFAEFDFDAAELSMDPGADLDGEQLELLPERKEKGINPRRFSREEIDRYLDEDELEPTIKAAWPDQQGSSPGADLSAVQRLSANSSDAPPQPRIGFSWNAPVSITLDDDEPLAEPTAQTSQTTKSAPAVPERFSEVLPDEQDAFSLTPSWSTSLGTGGAGTERSVSRDGWQLDSSPNVEPLGLDAMGLDSTGTGSKNPAEKIFSFRDSPRSKRWKERRRRQPLPEIEAFEAELILPELREPPRRSYPSGWKAVAIACSMPLAFTIGFWFWAQQLEATPPALVKLFHLGSEQLPKLPPPGLALVGVSSEVIGLDDGTKVLEIKGDILNATLQSFEGIKLEAKVYDQENRELESLIVDFNNGLSSARLQALKEDAILSLQQREGTGERALKPSMKSPFRIVLPKLSGEEAWFTARIFSVL